MNEDLASNRHLNFSDDEDTSLNAWSTNAPKLSSEPKHIVELTDANTSVGAKKKAPPAGPAPVPRKARDVLASSAESMDGGIASTKRSSIDALIANSASEEHKDSKGDESDDGQDHVDIKVPFKLEC